MKSYTTDVKIRLSIVGVPSEVTIVDSIPPTVKLQMEGKVFSQLYYKFFPPEAKINFPAKFQKSNSQLVITADDIYAAVNLNNLERPVTAPKSPAGFPLTFTAVSHEGKKVPVTFANSIRLQLNPVNISMVNWPVCSPDSVVIYAKKEVLETIESVALQPFTVKNLSDTIVTVPLKPIPNVRCEIKQVTMRLKLEKNYLKRASIPIEPKEIKGQRIFYQPATVDILYYVPESFYHAKAPTVAVFAEDIDLTKKSGRVAVRKAEEFPHRKIYKILTDSVNWMIK
ncbi:MAG: hypothetical protein ACI30R_00605 [Sodaliphilus sp.]